ncbi:uncharacterized protein LOC120533603 [Polypterus senegalus]|uniref:uncharacterized protein LOC120533603 n=1 Tax=Polypterus senegalus TaxID=55291 RepID=UPI0019649478|nr:uncharacterized protein LOC120533603 [Polypterus senegalus]XP_039616457.1 uncharacterized protein LOC120533603 [Polypterus senegalus]
MAPYLKGPAQRVYYDLTKEQAADYDALKSEVFKRYGTSPEQQTREWREWQFDPDRPLRTQAFEAWNKVCRWLRPNINNSHKMGELLACKTFVHALPDHIAQQVRKQPYDNMDTLIKIAEHHWAACKSGRLERFSRHNQPVCGTAPEPPQQAPEPVVCKRDKPFHLPCYFKCAKMGYLSPNCPCEPMDCSLVKGERLMHRTQD